MSAEISICRGSRRFPIGGRQHQSAVAAERGDPTGVGEQGTFTARSSRNLGGPVVSVNESGLGMPVNNSRPAAVASCSCGNETQDAGRYRAAKATKQRGRTVYVGESLQLSVIASTFAKSVSRRVGLFSINLSTPTPLFAIPGADVCKLLQLREKGQPADLNAEYVKKLNRLTAESWKKQAG